ncbi:MAG: hypothetical protein WDM77_16815 [Steroidobacteraceae bacterium]
MAVIRQYLLLLKLGLSTLPQRRATALTVLIATACVVGVLLSMLSATAGVVDAFRTATDPHIAVVLSNKDRFDSNYDLPRDVIGTILNAPGFAHGPDGKVLGDPELLFFTPPAHRIASGGSLRIRGMGARGAAIRPGFRITSGRMFQSGRQETDRRCRHAACVRPQHRRQRPVPGGLLAHRRSVRRRWRQYQ